MQAKLLQLTTFKVVSPLANLQAFMFGRLGIVSLTIFVIVLCLGFALGLGFCSEVEVQKIVEN